MAYNNNGVARLTGWKSKMFKPNNAGESKYAIAMSEAKMGHSGIYLRVRRYMGKAPDPNTSVWKISKIRGSAWKTYNRESGKIIGSKWIARRVGGPYQSIAWFVN
jgi:hypothetical protein